MQLVMGEYYQQQAEDNRIRIVPIMPSRGLIYDRNGQPLVWNAAQYNATITPADLPDENPERVFLALETVLNMTAADIQRQLEEGKAGNSPYSPIVIKKHLDRETALLLREMLPRLPGVNLEIEPLRVYADGAVAPHVLGYVGPISSEEFEMLRSNDYYLNDFIGKTGLEREYEEYLRGVPGRQQIEVDVGGHELRVLARRDPQPGYSLVLSLDWELQKETYEILRKSVPAGDIAAAVVMDVHTGEILAMASLPSYDANIFSPTISSGDWQTLLNDPHKPLVNHVLSEMYPPGSIFKQVTGLAALQEGIATPSTVITSRGRLVIFNEFDPNVPYIFPDWAYLGPLNFYQGVAMSSDVYFYCLAGGCEQERMQGLGADRLASYARAFGLGEPTGIDLPGESAGIVPTPQWKIETFGDPWTTGDTYNFGIGQGFLTVTPLQMAVVTAAVANGGNVVTPRLVREIVDQNGKAVMTFKPEVKRSLPIDSSHLQVMRDAMRMAVDSGTAKTARLSSVTIAGKTGTAEFGETRPDGSHETHGWFAAFAPYDDPQVAIIVFHQHGNGANTAAPTAARILEYYFGKVANVQRGPSSR